MSKKWLYVVFGVVIGFVLANAFSIPELMAQYALRPGRPEFDNFREVEMSPSVNAEYGNLVAVSGLDLYFQNADGVIHIVRQRTSNSIDQRVSVIKRDPAKQ